jgi:hypothetical protein
MVTMNNTCACIHFGGGAQLLNQAAPLFVLVKSTASVAPLAGNSLKVVMLIDHNAAGGCWCTLLRPLTSY